MTHNHCSVPRYGTEETLRIFKAKVAGRLQYAWRSFTEEKPSSVEDKAKFYEYLLRKVFKELERAGIPLDGDEGDS